MKHHSRVLKLFELLHISLLISLSLWFHISRPFADLFYLLKLIYFFLNKQNMCVQLEQIHPQKKEWIYSSRPIYWRKHISSNLQIFLARAINLRPKLWTFRFDLLSQCHWYLFFYANMYRCFYGILKLIVITNSIIQLVLSFVVVVVVFGTILLNTTDDLIVDSIE